MTQRSPTEAAATALYDRVIDEFGSTVPRELFDRSLKHKPPEYFADIAQRLRRRLAMYTGSNTESTGNPVEVDPSAVEAIQTSHPPASFYQGPDEQAPHHPHSLLLIPNRTQPPFHVNLDAIGRPAPFMANPHQPAPSPPEVTAPTDPATTTRGRGRPIVSQAARKSLQQQPAPPRAPPTDLEAMATSPPLHPPRGGMVGVYASTKFSPKASKRQFALLAAIVRLYEPWAPSDSGPSIVTVALEDGKWGVATIVDATEGEQLPPEPTNVAHERPEQRSNDQDDDDSNNDGVLVQLVESGTKRRVHQRRLFVGIDHFVSTSGTVVLQVREQSAEVHHAVV